MKNTLYFFGLFFIATRTCSALRVVTTNTQQCFPKTFTFGVATAAYQIEGAWNASGKSESIWDRYTHDYPERIADRKNADIADDSYHLFREDVQLMKHLGVEFYRFSIAWPRILPTGFDNFVNPDGVRYYKALIKELQDNGIKPIVTMYHWDLPQSLQDLGGWTNPIIADYFEDYARVLFETFGKDIHAWITVNEPLSFCLEGYGGDQAPGARSSGIQAYMCAHNVLRAHGKVYRMYNREYREKLKVPVGITLNGPWIEPATESQADGIAAETGIQFSLGWYAHPIFSKSGDYPEVMRRNIDEMSRTQNFSKSRLPRFTRDEIEQIRGSFDFFGYNHYTTLIASAGRSTNSPQPSYYDDMGVTLKINEKWPATNSSWLRVVPWGFRKALNWIKEEYDNPLVFITENGVSSEPGIEDNQRVEYIDSYVKNLHDAVIQDGCNVLGYTYWSLMDNYEWLSGFSERFGLYEVDYNDPGRKRTPRDSARYFQKLATTKCIPSDFSL